MKRRHFLQFSGSALAALGLSQGQFSRQAMQYGRVLAQDTPRKRALLIGINAYPEPTTSLHGCLTDVDLQRELLIHRFSFNPRDIIELSDRTPDKPTRANILQVFEEELIAGTKAGDVVVVHYSGHGSRMIDLRPLRSDGLVGTILPGDLPGPGGKGDAPDISERSLFLLSRLIPTEALTVVLDCCFSGSSTRGNALVRSESGHFSRTGFSTPLSAAELADQERWLAQLNLSLEEFEALRAQGIAKGVAIGSALGSQTALEIPMDGFSAGAFTYLLTRYLWQAAGGVSAAELYEALRLSTAALAARRGAAQPPSFETQLQQNQDRPVYFLPLAGRSAEAVVTEQAGERVQLWLGGVSPQRLPTATSRFSAVDDQGQLVGEVQCLERAGLRGVGRWVKGDRALLRPGLRLREQIIALPTRPKLRLGIDESLQDDRAELEAAIAELPMVELVPTTDRTPLDGFLGRLTAEMQFQLQVQELPTLPSVNSIGLFGPTLSPLTEGFGPPEESPTQAVARLRPRLVSLLVDRILQQLETGPVSSLRVSARVRDRDSGQVIRAVATRGAQEAGSRVEGDRDSRTAGKVSIGRSIEIELINGEPENLYMGAIAIGTTGDITVLHPVTWDAPDDAALVRQNSSQVIPRPEDGVSLVTQGPPGSLEVMIFASRQPLSRFFQGLQRVAGQQKTRQGFLPLRGEESLDMLENLLRDLDSPRSAGAGSAASQPTSTVDTAAFVALSALWEIG